MLFTADFHPGLADGSITVTFRAWERPQAKVGGRYRVGPVTIEVDAMDRIDPASITDADARRSGSADRAAVVARLAPLVEGLQGRQGRQSRQVWRIEFHRAEDASPDPRLVLAAQGDLSADELAAVVARLDRLDAASRVGPWTRAVLDLIGDQPGVVSTELASALGRERSAFKSDVRKLKALGLTESLEVGYRLSPRGQAVRRASRQA